MPTDKDYVCWSDRPKNSPSDPEWCRQRERDRQNALAKLTDYEKSILGLTAL